MERAKVWAAVLLITFIFSAVHILSKAAFNGGMSTFVFVFYRQLVATLFLLPLSFFIQRKAVPAMSFSLCIRIFVLALLGITGNINLFCVALDYTSAALASEISNAIPVVTFILAALLRMEKVKVKRKSGIAKLTGVGLCVAGVLTIAFYSGPRLKALKQHSILQPHGNQKSPAGPPPPPSSSRRRWALGTFIMMIANLSWSLWSVLQGPLLKDYPSQLLLTALQSLFSTLQTFFVALAIERDFSRWKLGFGLSLISVAYSGIMVSGVGYFLQSWIIQKRGPIFLTLMAPLTLIVTMIVSYFTLQESISLGCVLGGALMVGGLYSVLWGKKIEEKEGEELPTASNKGTKSSIDDQETTSAGNHI